MLVTDQAKLIRLPLESLRVIGRGSAGVRLFNVSNNEHVVSAVRLDEPSEEEIIEAAIEGEASPETPAVDSGSPEADAPDTEA